MLNMHVFGPSHLSSQDRSTQPTTSMRVIRDN